MIAIVLPTMYISVGGTAVNGYGAGVAVAGSTAKEVIACDG